MGAFTGVQNCFNKPLVDVARDLGYDIDNILILEGNETRLRRDFPQTYNNLISCRHHADNRSPMEYGQDLVASWIFEDIFIKALNRSHSFTVNLDGADKNRKILASVQTSTSSDYMIQNSNGLRRKLELMTDYTGYWASKGKLHLRDFKYQRLQQSRSLFLAVSTMTKDFTIYDFGTQINATYIPEHKAYGYKPAYELSITSDQMIAYTSSNLIAAIEAML